MSNKISIVTAVYNGDKTLENLIASVISQDDNNYEFLIIDGASTDNSKNLILKYQDRISYWISEPDKGIYDAWNKGVNKATGDWIMFLGCDDILLPGSISKYRNFLEKTEKSDELDFVSSQLEMVDLQGETIRVKGWPWEWPKFLREMTIAHPGALHSVKFFEKYGIYDISYKIVGDFELLIRPKEKLKTAYLNEITVKMSEGGASDSVAAIIEHYRAATSTGGYSKSKGFLNLCLVYTKLKVKRAARKIGLNLYLNK